MSRSVRPVASRRSFRRLRICACTETSRDEVGSSQTMSAGAAPVRGRWTMPLALAARKRVREALRRSASRPTASSSRAASSAASAFESREAIEQDRLGQDRRRHACGGSRPNRDPGRSSGAPGAGPTRRSARPLPPKRTAPRHPAVISGPRRCWRPSSCRSRIRRRGRRSRPADVDADAVHRAKRPLPRRPAASRDSILDPQALDAEDRCRPRPAPPSPPCDRAAAGARLPAPRARRPEPAGARARVDARHGADQRARIGVAGSGQHFRRPDRSRRPCPDA